MQRLLLALLILLAHSGAALGCSCITVGDDRFSAPQAIRLYEAVFLGRVTSVEPPQPGTALLPFATVAVEFKVAEAWKGVEAPTVKVVTGIGDGDCGFTFDLGKDYLVFAEKGFYAVHELTATICSDTAEKRLARTKLRQLRKWQRPRTFR